MASAKKVWKASEGRIGKNAAYTVSDKGVLTVTVDLNVEQGPSASGKTMIIGTSSGNQQIDGGNGAVIGLNVYRKIEK
jgi:hypothetical protein